MEVAGLRAAAVGVDGERLAAAGAREELERQLGAAEQEGKLSRQRLGAAQQEGKLSRRRLEAAEQELAALRREAASPSIAGTARPGDAGAGATDSPAGAETGAADSPVGAVTVSTDGPSTDAEPGVTDSPGSQAGSAAGSPSEFAALPAVEFDIASGSDFDAGSVRWVLQGRRALRDPAQGFGHESRPKSLALPTG
jgi:hypothetical protein